jgi:hypothetical protein
MLLQQKIGTVMCLFFWTSLIKTIVNGRPTQEQFGPKNHKYFYHIRR